MLITLVHQEGAPWGKLCSHRIMRRLLKVDHTSTHRGRTKGAQISGTTAYAHAI